MKKTVVAQITNKTIKLNFPKVQNKNPKIDNSIIPIKISTNANTNNNNINITTNIDNNTNTNNNTDNKNIETLPKAILSNDVEILPKNILSNDLAEKSKNISNGKNIPVILSQAADKNMPQTDKNIPVKKTAPLSLPKIRSTPHVSSNIFKVMSESDSKKIYAPPDIETVILVPVIIANHGYLICHENQCLYSPSNQEKIGFIQRDRSIIWYNS